MIFFICDLLIFFAENEASANEHLVKRRTIFPVKYTDVKERNSETKTPLSKMRDMLVQKEEELIRSQKSLAIVWRETTIEDIEAIQELLSSDEENFEGDPLSQAPIHPISHQSNTDAFKVELAQDLHSPMVNMNIREAQEEPQQINSVLLKMKPDDDGLRSSMAMNNTKIHEAVQNTKLKISVISELKNFNEKFPNMHQDRKFLKITVNYCLWKQWD
jgi:hypothetical protein